VPKDRAGILVDEQFGEAILDDARRSGFMTAAPAEESGRDEFDFEYGEQYAAHIERFQPTFCKVQLVGPGSPAPAERPGRGIERHVVVARKPQTVHGRLWPQSIGLWNQTRLSLVIESDAGAGPRSEDLPTRPEQPPAGCRSPGNSYPHPSREEDPT
jgi:hypothetical protein